MRLRSRLAIPLAISAATALFAHPAGVRADVVDDNPAAVATSGGGVQVLARGVDGSVYVRARTSTGWSTWTSLGGQTTSGPAAAAYGEGLEIFARGPGDEIVHRTWSPSGGSEWASLGGGSTSAPAATALRGTNRLYVFIRGTDDALYYRSFTPAGGWAPWARLGGAITSAPSAISRTDGIIDVFARGASGQLAQISLVDGVPTAWSSLGPILTAAPGATAPGARHVEVFGRGVDGALRRKTWTGGWSEPILADTAPLTSGPSAVAEDPSRISVFARIGSAVSVNQFVDGRSSGWNSLGEVVAGPDCLSPQGLGESTRLFARVKRRPGAEVSRAGARAMLEFGRRARITGRLTTADRAPIAGAAVCIGVRNASQGAPLVQKASAMTDEGGRFTYVTKPGPSRAVYFGSRTAEGEGARAKVSVKVAAAAHLRATPRRLKNGESVRFEGRLPGRPLPENGALVELQVWLSDRKEWRTFATRHTTRRGRFAFRYEFTRTTTSQTYRFRAHVPQQGAYPYAAAGSRVVEVRVGSGNPQ